MPHFLVTGGAGFIGSHLVERLLENGHAVTVVDDFSTGSFVNLEAAGLGRAGASGDLIVGDFGLERVLGAVGGSAFDAVFHLAAISDTTATDQARVLTVNYTNTLALIDACAHAGTPLVHAGSASVYGSRIDGAREPFVADDDENRSVFSGPLNVYAFSKALVDRHLRRRLAHAVESAVSRVVSFRFFNVFGPNESAKGAAAAVVHQYVARAAGGERIVCFDDAIDAARDWVPIALVVDTMVTALERLQRDELPGGVYNLGTGTALSFGRVIELLAGATGRPLEDARTLAPNPYADRYQYYTCADVRALAKHGIDTARSGAEVEAAILALFEWYRDGRGVPWRAPDTG